MLKRRRRGAHARVVSHGSVGKGDVEVLADQNSLARDVDRGDRSLQSRFAMYEVRSTIRQLKPHSLSYQLTTFAQSPASIAVDGASTIDECGSFLKSDDTSSSWLTACTLFSSPLAAFSYSVLSAPVAGVLPSTIV